MSLRKKKFYRYNFLSWKDGLLRPKVLYLFLRPTLCAIAFLSQGFSPLSAADVMNSQEREKLLAQAVENYDKGQWPSAAQKFEELIKNGHKNGFVFYNLGNSYYKSGESDKALAALLTARYFEPRQSEIAQNIDLILQKEGFDSEELRITVAKPKLSFKTWPDLLAPRELAWLSSIIVAMLLVLISLKAIYRRPKIVWELYLPLGFAILLLSYAWNSKVINPTRWAVVNTSNCIAFSGPSASESKLFDLHKNIPVILKNQSEKDWYLIETIEGNKGWVQRSQVTSYF